MSALCKLVGKLTLSVESTGKVVGLSLICQHDFENNRLFILLQILEYLKVNENIIKYCQKLD